MLMPPTAQHTAAKTKLSAQTQETIKVSAPPHIQAEYTPMWLVHDMLDTPLYINRLMAATTPTTVGSMYACKMWMPLVTDLNVVS